MTIDPNKIVVGKLISGDLFLGLQDENKILSCIKLTFMLVETQIKFEMGALFSVLFPNILPDIETSKILFHIIVPDNLSVLKDEYIRIVNNKLEIETQIQKQIISKLH